LQARQFAAVVDPLTTLAVPAAHCVHAASVWPAATWYEPAGHGAQSAAADEPTRERPVPAPHKTHRAEPVTFA